MKKTKSTKRNIIKAIILITLMLSFFGMTACGNDSELTVENKWEQFPEEMASQEFLPQGIVDDLSEFSIEEDSEGVPFYYWRSVDEKAVDEKDKVIHKIELKEVDGVLTYYHYKNYYYDVPNLDSPMSKDDAEDMVNEFAKSFIQSGDELTFKNGEGASSLYEPDHVEGWVADSENNHHTVMVDLDMGSIIYYSYYMD